MFVVGLTGGIGSGKSAVADCFGELGVEVIDADFAARQVVIGGSEALAIIAAHFGSDILLADGTLNRSKLRSVIFNNPSEKQWLEGLLHPLINQWIENQLRTATSHYAILESPLLIEAKQAQLTDRILVVDIPEALQLERASIRDNNSPDQIKAIMATQLNRQERLSYADDIINNSAAVTETQQQVLLLHKKYLILTKRP